MKRPSRYIFNYKWSAQNRLPKDLVRGLEELETRGRTKTMQTTALLTLARLLRSVLKICNHQESSKRQLTKVGEKNSQEVIS